MTTASQKSSVDYALIISGLDDQLAENRRLTAEAGNRRRALALEAAEGDDAALVELRTVGEEMDSLCRSARNLEDAREQAESLWKNSRAREQAESNRQNCLRADAVRAEILAESAAIDNELHSVCNRLRHRRELLEEIEKLVWTPESPQNAMEIATYKAFNAPVAYALSHAIGLAGLTQIIPGFRAPISAPLAESDRQGIRFSGAVERMIAETAQPEAA